ncbi:MAG TPA: 3-deoxy-manno-octulosonate cytidylyltransferase [Rhizomicrobium sp.]|jgi:3-deoxy-manno-octulosonate cytidylyltransferase (CMP-KDO synthetase)|nr:3-deoxy-manno-octulosonate cytidylyltransferase [Rhizomicrobium sp.]
MSSIVIIPARMASTRLPGKPLADIAGLPMIVRVWKCAVAAAIGPVAVAAGDVEIASAICQAGGTAVLTSPALPSGTDRVFAALESLDGKREYETVVNLQGDLPLLDPEQLRRAVDTLATSGADIATLAAPIAEPRDCDNTNVVKPVIAWREGELWGRALYFTRARAPHGDGTFYHHIGIYAFRREALERFVALPPSPLERRENLEQLRALEAGMTIAVGRVDEVPLSVDTPADLESVRAAAVSSAAGNR